MNKKINILLVFIIFLYSKLLLAVPFEGETMVKEFEKLNFLVFSKTAHKEEYDKYMNFLRGEWRISKNLSRNRITLEDSRKLIGKYIRVEGNRIYFPNEYQTLAYNPSSKEIISAGYEIKEIHISVDFLTVLREFQGVKEATGNYGLEYGKDIAYAQIKIEGGGSLGMIHIAPNRIMSFGDFLLLTKESQPMFKEFNQFEHIKVSKDLNKNDYNKYMSYLRGKWKITDNINDSINHRKNPPTNIEKYNGSFVIIKGDRILFPDSFFIDNYFDDEFSRHRKKRKKRGYKIDYVACIVGRTYEFFSDGGPNYDPGVAGLEDDVEVAEAQIKFIGDDYFHTTFFHLSPVKMKMGIWTRYFTLEKVE